MPSYEATIKFKVLNVKDEHQATSAALKILDRLPHEVVVDNDARTIFVHEYPTVSIISNNP